LGTGFAKDSYLLVAAVGQDLHHFVDVWPTERRSGDDDERAFEAWVAHHIFREGGGRGHLDAEVNPRLQHPIPERADKKDSKLILL
jgi:hypothetical protein